MGICRKKPYRTFEAFHRLHVSLGAERHPCCLIWPLKGQPGVMGSEVLSCHWLYTGCVILVHFLPLSGPQLPPAPIIERVEQGIFWA